jgi:hypothetical protein
VRRWMILPDWLAISIQRDAILKLAAEGIDPWFLRNRLHRSINRPVGIGSIACVVSRRAVAVPYWY